MQLSNPSASISRRARAVALILIIATTCLGQASRPSQSEPVKKTQPASPTASPAKEEQQDQAIKLEATLVTVPVIASDRDGRYIPDMSREDFTLYEDDTRQEIVFFATVSEPFHVVLMLDTSASTQDKLGQIRSAATTFVEQLKAADRVKVIAFDDAVRDLSEFTSDRSELRQAIDRTQPGRGTKLYDAVALALRALRSIQGRKAVVLFTDGVDRTSDSVRYEDNIEAVEESGVIVYPIRYDTRAETEAMLRSQGGLGGVINRPPVGTTPPTVPGGNRPQLPPIGGPTTRDPRIPPVGAPPGSPYPRNTPYPGGRPDDRSPDPRFPQDNRVPDVRYPRRDDGLSTELDAAYRVADRYLAEIAAKSGGTVTRADTLYSLPAAFARIAAELRTQYALGYYPSNSARDGSYRKIQVRTKRKNVAIRARPGYRAGS